MTIIIFILVLLVTVLVHEWGHYFAAKRSGMQVDEFGFGIPPRLFSWKRGLTRFSVNALPIGGFVRIAGETGDPRPDVLPGRLFTERPRYQQAIVLVAGVVCNFLLGWLLLSASYTIGVPHVAETGTPQVISLAPGAPAVTAGLELRDKVVAAKAGKTELQHPDTEAIRSLLQAELGKEVTFTVDRKGTLHTVTVLPHHDATANTYTIGIALEPLETVQLPVHKALVLGLKDAWEITKNVVHALGMLVAGIFTSGGAGLNQFIGPVGLATAVSDASQVGISYFFSFIALISLNLAVLNLAPFPALDGGRLLILGLETLTRRKFNKMVVGIIHTVGFGLLILLMIFLTIQDVRHL